jgi:hypothetical protein
LFVVVLPSACTRAGTTAEATTSLPPAEIPVQVTESARVTAEPEPTGVPGLAADDPFCSAWAGYVGTLQALGTAASFGDLASSQLAALELASAPYLVEVADTIDASWPPDLATEHVVAIEQRIGPYSRRATTAVGALLDAGVSEAELTTLSSTWQSALLGRDPEAPVIALPPVADELRAKIVAAATAYDGAVTPFAQDPSLVVDGVEQPMTDAYLVAHCPDLASSGVGDAL